MLEILDKKNVLKFFPKGKYLGAKQYKVYGTKKIVQHKQKSETIRNFVE